MIRVVVLVIVAVVVLSALVNFEVISLESVKKNTWKSLVKILTRPPAYVILIM